MANLEQMRRAARGRQRLNLKDLHLICQRCEKRFRSRRIDRECYLCGVAGMKVYGTTHPRVEMSGM